PTCGTSFRFRGHRATRGIEGGGRVGPSHGVAYNRDMPASSETEADRTLRRIAAVRWLAWFVLAIPALAAAQRTPTEYAPGWTDKQPVTARHWMVAAANPLAVEAGNRTLK